MTAARNIPISPGRRFVSDLMWLSRRIPLSVMKRTVDVGPVLVARAASRDRIPWSILVAKAYALACREHPQFRRIHALLPWPHLHEPAASTATIMIERDWNGEKALLYARLPSPETHALGELAGILRQSLDVPVNTFHAFRSVRILSRLPLPIRRLVYWFAFNNGPDRARFFGTFAITALGHRGMQHVFPLSPLTSVLTMGPIDETGRMEVTIGFDHRVVDGADVADVTETLASVLNGVIVDELRALPPLPLAVA
jgi:hypothetical protein